jgi:hypothetical protein
MVVKDVDYCPPTMEKASRVFSENYTFDPPPTTSQVLTPFPTTEYVPITINENEKITTIQV